MARGLPAAGGYLRWELSPEQVERCSVGPVTVVVDHPAYRAEQRLSDDSLAELRHDLWHRG